MDTMDMWLLIWLLWGGMGPVLALLLRRARHAHVRVMLGAYLIPIWLFCALPLLGWTALRLSGAD